jgi:pimeloyl-ACP methyl ester carboxylesterase
VSAATTANPAAAFYATPAARLLRATLRLAHRWSPALANRLALQLFFTPLPGKQQARAKAVPATWTASRHPFEGGELTTWQRPDAAGRPRVLLVHGWAGDAQQWRPLGDRLAAAGFDPVLLDLPAHGRSDGARSTLPQWVRALFAVSARLGPWHGIAAHSLGALASAHAAARGLPVKRLALVATSPPPRQFLRWFAGVLGPGEALAARMQASIERREGVPMEQFEPAWLGSRLAQPTLVVHDRDDRTAPFAGAERFAASVAGARLVAPSGLGHRRVLADASVLEEIVEHLGGAGFGARPHPGPLPQAGEGAET